MVHSIYRPAKVSIYFPENYSSNKKYPLLLWLNGGDGGPGTQLKIPKSITRNKDFICMNFPLFKNSLDPVNADSSNYWKRMYLDSINANIIWNSYKILLDTVFKVVPNIDTNNTFIGGFSNGAHTIAILLNREKAEIKEYINHFFMIEGGSDFENIEVLKDHNLLLIIGENNIELEYKQKIKNIYESAHQANVNTTFFIMDSTGHKFPEKYHPMVKKWLSCSLEKKTK